jgi:hypothetical protein
MPFLQVAHKSWSLDVNASSAPSVHFLFTSNLLSLLHEYV